METHTWNLWSRDKYIQGKKHIVADVLSRFTMNKNQETTQESTYEKEIMQDINDTE